MPDSPKMKKMDDFEIISSINTLLTEAYSDKLISDSAYYWRLRAKGLSFTAMRSHCDPRW